MQSLYHGCKSFRISYRTCLGFLKNKPFNNLRTMTLYQRNTLPIGIEIFGVDLNKPINDEEKKQIMQDVTKHRIVVLRNQGKVAGSRQVEISRWFGDIDNVTYAKHPLSPSVDIFRVSNDPEQGCTGVGISGWHIDGTFREAPYAYSIYHMVSPPLHGGETMFIPLTEIIEKLPLEQRKKWERLWMLSDRLENLNHPLVYNHPRTGRPTLCFHQGMTAAFIQDYDSLTDKNDIEKYILNEKESLAVHDEIEAAINNTPIYSHKWQQSGDFIISDNLAVGHMAGPIPPLEKSGLRVLHRVTVKGTVPPSKRTDVNFPYKDNCAY